MTIKINDKEYRVQFEYPDEPYPAGKITICHINDMVHFAGIALCNPKDQFCKATGRKIALSHALKSIGLDKPARRQFWAEYFKLTNKNYKS